MAITPTVKHIEFLFLYNFFVPKDSEMPVRVRKRRYKSPFAQIHKLRASPTILRSIRRVSSAPAWGWRPPRISLRTFSRRCTPAARFPEIAKTSFQLVEKRFFCIHLHVFAGYRPVAVWADD